MMRRIVSICLVLLLACPFIAVESSGAMVPDETFYCYGNTVHCKYPSGNLDEMDVSWSVSDDKGAVVPFTLVNEGYITVDATNLDDVFVTQTVSGSNDTDSMIMRVIPLHLDSSDTVKVEYIDDGKVVNVININSNTVVRYGDNHSEPPNLPDRVGQSFMGWFTDTMLTEPFDPKKPVLEDTKVYSKWVVSAVPDGSEITGNNVVVTFHSVPGLTYSITGKGSDWISFDVVIKDGYSFKDGSIKVDVDGIRIEPVLGSDHSYKISCSQDRDVVIGGDRSYSIVYDMTNTSVSVDHHDVPPTVFPDTGISMTILADDGHADPSVKVYSDGVDVTPSYVSGNRVTIPYAIGNILVVSSADPIEDDGFPLWWLLIIILIISMIVIAVFIKRNRND